jgi:hypothetical protein
MALLRHADRLRRCLFIGTGSDWRTVTMTRMTPSGLSGLTSAPVTEEGLVVGIGKITVRLPMKLFPEGRTVLRCFPVLLLLSGCGEATPECDSLDTRNTVIKIISDDSHNALVNYAAKNSSVVAAMVRNANTEAEKSAILEKARQDAAYRLDDAMRTNSINRAKRAVTCTGLLYATVEDATAQKELDFKVEQTADGKISISLVPFQF